MLKLRKEKKLPKGLHEEGNIKTEEKYTLDRRGIQRGSNKKERKEPFPQSNRSKNTDKTSNKRINKKKFKKTPYSNLYIKRARR